MKKLILTIAALLSICLLSVSALAAGDAQQEPAAPLSPGLETSAHPAYVHGSGDKFRPGGTLTRAEICSLVYSLLKAEPEEDGSDLSFTDVKPDAWYYQYVMPLAKMGAIGGYKDGSFRPNQNTTRAELVQVLCRFFEKPELRAEKAFTDLTSDHPAYEAIMDAVSMGWLEGYPDGSFRPDNSLTRAEAVTLVNRALGRKADKGLIDYDGKIMLYLDVPFTHWAYYDIMEASIPHAPEIFPTAPNNPAAFEETWYITACLPPPANPATTTSTASSIAWIRTATGCGT